MRAIHFTTVLACLGLLSCGARDPGDPGEQTELVSFGCPSSYAPGGDCSWPGATVTWGKSQTSKQQLMLAEWPTSGLACFFEPTSLALEGAVRWDDGGVVRAGEVPNGKVPPKVKPVEAVESCGATDAGSGADQDGSVRGDV